jgi:RNA polymerase sigma-70 factor, ECF subfamily
VRGPRLGIVTGGPRAEPNPQQLSVVSQAVESAVVEPEPTLIERTSPMDIERVFRAHFDRLVRSLTVACGDAELAADAVQEAFVRAHVRWRRLRHYDDPVGWVRRVAVNLLRDQHRRTKRKDRAVARLAATPAQPDGTPEPDRLGELLDQLPRQQRIAVALYYVDGLSVAEVAAAMGLAEGSVKSHLHDARQRLRAVIGEEE